MRSPTQAKSGIAAWYPIIGLALAAFVFNTSEFLPVGLLPEIASSLEESVSDTGLILTGYAGVVAIMSLPLTILTARLPRRTLLLALVAIFAACHFVVMLVDGFWSLMLARIGVALTHAIFWSIMTPLAARVAPSGRRTVGLAAVMGGTIVATVLGVPIGTQLGQLFGWQEAFCIVGVAAALVWCMIFVTLPACKSTRAGSLASLPAIVRRPALLQLYALTLITVLGQFTAYSFIAPIVSTAGGFSPSEIVPVLFVFGVAGIFGTALSTYTLERSQSFSLIAPMLFLNASLFLLVAACYDYVALLMVVGVWGAAVAGVCLSFQTILLNAAPDCADVATSLYSAIFNVGIGAGAYLGGQVSEQLGFLMVADVGGVLVLVGLITLVAVRIMSGNWLIPFAAQPKAAPHDTLPETSN